MIKDKRYILIGGGRVWKGETKDIDDYVYKEASKISKEVSLLLFPTASKDREDYIEAVKETYSNLGAKVNIVEFFNKEYSIYELKELINNATIIYLGSGDPEVFSKKLLELGIKEEFINLLKEYSGLMVGSSAGAVLIGERYIDISEKKPVPKDGWSILKNINIIPHFNEGSASNYPGYIPIRNSEYIEVRVDELGEVSLSK